MWTVCPTNKKEFSFVVDIFCVSSDSVLTRSMWRGYHKENTWSAQNPPETPQLPSDANYHWYLWSTNSKLRPYNLPLRFIMGWGTQECMLILIRLTVVMSELIQNNNKRSRDPQLSVGTSLSQRSPAVSYLQTLNLQTSKDLCYLHMIYHVTGCISCCVSYCG